MQLFDIAMLSTPCLALLTLSVMTAMKGGPWLLPALASLNALFCSVFTFKVTA